MTHEEYEDALDMASEKLLSNVDSIADWINGECIGSYEIRTDSLVESIKRKKASVDDFSNAELFALLFSTNPQNIVLASHVLKERYLEDNKEFLNSYLNEFLEHIENERNEK